MTCGPSNRDRVPPPAGDELLRQSLQPLHICSEGQNCLTTTVTADADNSIWSQDPYWINANGPALWLSNVQWGGGSNPTEDRTLLHFSNTQIQAAVPAGRRLRSATLILTTRSTGLAPNGGVPDLNLGVRRLRVSWSEHSNWKCREADTGGGCVGGQSWDMNGGQGTVWSPSGRDFRWDPHASGVQLRVDVTEDVQLFLDDTAQNHGWMVRHVGAPDFIDSHTFYSREESDAARRPRLEIETVNSSGPSVPPPTTDRFDDRVQALLTAQGGWNPSAEERRRLGVVRGIVRSADGTTPFNGAVVSCVGEDVCVGTATTNAQGVFSLVVRAGGRIRVHVEAGAAHLPVERAV